SAGESVILFAIVPLPTFRGVEKYIMTDLPTRLLISNDPKTLLPFAILDECLKFVPSSTP
ncbi:MAG TPA: hypothetical protein VE243_01765, partial [Candidatus Acidoferrum sp.]|nr:hypothetical protein [Candidatus Acidoferrum sp.]